MKTLTVEQAVERGWSFEDRPWREDVPFTDIVATKDSETFRAGFRDSRRQTDRPNAIRLVLRKITGYEQCSGGNHDSTHAATSNSATNH